MGHERLPLFVHWSRTVGEILDCTIRFPKSVRFTFARRIDDHALDVLEWIVEACYARRGETAAALRRIDGALARLRVLLRLSYERRLLDHSGYEHLSRALVEAGRMVGGWSQHQAGARP